jgi:hypothetical protein
MQTTQEVNVTVLRAVADQIRDVNKEIYQKKSFSLGKWITSLFSNTKTDEITTMIHDKLTPANFEDTADRFRMFGKSEIGNLKEAISKIKNDLKSEDPYQMKSGRLDKEKMKGVLLAAICFSRNENTRVELAGCLQLLLGTEEKLLNESTQETIEILSQRMFAEQLQPPPVPVREKKISENVEREQNVPLPKGVRREPPQPSIMDEMKEALKARTEKQKPKVPPPVPPRIKKENVETPTSSTSSTEEPDVAPPPPPRDDLEALPPTEGKPVITEKKLVTPDDDRPLPPPPLPDRD